MAKLYCINLVDKTKWNWVCFRITCVFGLVAIWPIALIDRLRFLFLSPLFLVRTFTKANLCLAPPSPPTVPGSSVPIELLQLRIYFYRDTNMRWKRKRSTEIVQSERGRVEWKSCVPLSQQSEYLVSFCLTFIYLKLQITVISIKRYSLQKPLSQSRIKH